MTSLKNLKYEFASVTVLRNIFSDRVLSLFYNFLNCNGDLTEKISIYSEFVFALQKHSGLLSEYLKNALFEDENEYIILKAKNKSIAESILNNLQHDLKILTLLSDISVEDIREYISYDGYLPCFENEHIDFSECYFERAEKVATLGYGIFASNPMFKVVDTEIVPVESSDSVTVDEFVGYAEERKTVIENTVALLEGRAASNILLYGDAGTGKSSTVKAVTNLLFDRGLRLIEIRKDQLLFLSDIMGKIKENPLKFILFIDDLSFNKNDDQFSMLKAALEGSASVKSANSVIYATSNRRHIVKETFSERSASDDIHRNDTVQELLSLSDRFGLTVYFSKPGKNLYLEIVQHLALRYGLDCDDNELKIKAEAFALQRGSRSPRVAEQFVKNEKNKQ